MKALLKKVKLAIADSKLGGFLTTPVYKLTYRRKDGGIGVYRVSRPIDRYPNRMTAYAFGKGIRSFCYEGIIDREVVSL